VASTSATGAAFDLPHIVILGAGFAGLYATMALARSWSRLTVIDRANHHLFQPLLYQVATASLNPSDIAQPIRSILRRQKNTRVILAEALRIDTERRAVILADGEVGYDYLIVATGAGNWHFGHDNWIPHAPGLKNLDDALSIRQKFLLSFEHAEREPDPARRREILTFVIVGGGPTGVELAGAMAEIARRAMPGEFRSIDTTASRIILVEGSDRLLNTFAPMHSRRTKADLERMGVEVWLGARVTAIDETGVSLDGMGKERIATRNVFWAAGVRASPLGGSLGVATERGGRVPVEPDLSIAGHPEVFVVGDLAHAADRARGRDVPGVAPAAMQMGRHVGRLLRAELAAKRRGRPLPPRPTFKYVDRGILATIGRDRAVGTVFGLQLQGFPAWFMWCFVHILFLVGFRNRVLVMIQWAWAYLRWERGARLITERSAGGEHHEAAGAERPR
jgi:NADH dehydrogenase